MWGRHLKGYRKNLPSCQTYTLMMINEIPKWEGHWSTDTHIIGDWNNKSFETYTLYVYILYKTGRMRFFFKGQKV